MARTVRNAKIDTRSARLKLTRRREPHWTPISAGCALGYRRGRTGGTWIARFRGEDGKQHYQALGAADDTRDADGLTAYSFAQAQKRAGEFFAQQALASHAEPTDSRLTIADALDAYFADREQRGSKGLKQDRSMAQARILPELGAIELSKLTTKRIRDWQSALATAPKFARTSRFATDRKVRDLDVTDIDALRARRATANRTLTVLKATLNHAYQEGHVASDGAWRKVKPFRGADAPVIRFLSSDEAVRIVNACDGEFRNLVKGALLTGCRYGELTRMRTADFNAEAGIITVHVSKSDRPRHVVLTDEGRALFAELTAKRAERDLVFARDDGGAWGASHQQRPLEVACAHARINPAVTFHILRHTYASMLAMRGVQMSVITAQLGHADTRTTEAHYAHLSPGYIADTVRAALPALGIVDRSNVAALSTVRSKA